MRNVITRDPSDLVFLPVCVTQDTEEVGCGWGSLAIRAAQRFPKLGGWTAITISRHGITMSLPFHLRQQLELARQRVAAAGVQDLVRVIFCDYRDVAAPWVLEAARREWLGSRPSSAPNSSPKRRLGRSLTLQNLTSRSMGIRNTAS